MWWLLLACSSPPPAPPAPTEALTVPSFGSVGLRPARGAARGLVLNLGAPVGEIPADLVVLDVPLDTLRADPGGACRDYAHLLAPVVLAARSSGVDPALPVALVGSDWGAGVAWAALAQAPGADWAGAVGAGFCPTLDTSETVCPSEGWTPSAPPSVYLPPLRRVGPGRFVVVRACTQAFSWLGAMGPAAHNAPTLRVGLDQVLRAVSASPAAGPPG